MVNGLKAFLTIFLSSALIVDTCWLQAQASALESSSDISRLPRTVLSKSNPAYWTEQALVQRLAAAHLARPRTSLGFLFLNGTAMAHASSASKVVSDDPSGSFISLLNVASMLAVLAIRIDLNHLFPRRSMEEPKLLDKEAIERLNHWSPKHLERWIPRDILTAILTMRRQGIVFGGDGSVYQAFIVWMTNSAYQGTDTPEERARQAMIRLRDAYHYHPQSDGSESPHTYRFTKFQWAQFQALLAAIESQFELPDQSLRRLVSHFGLAATDTYGNITSIDSWLYAHSKSAALTEAVWKAVSDVLGISDGRSARIQVFKHEQLHHYFRWREGGLRLSEFRTRLAKVASVNGTPSNENSLLSIISWLWGDPVILGGAATGTEEKIRRHADWYIEEFLVQAMEHHLAHGNLDEFFVLLARSDPAINTNSFQDFLQAYVQTAAHDYQQLTVPIGEEERNANLPSWNTMRSGEPRLRLRQFLNGRAAWLRPFIVLIALLPLSEAVSSVVIIPTISGRDSLSKSIVREIAGHIPEPRVVHQPLETAA